MQVEGAGSGEVVEAALDVVDRELTRAAVPREELAVGHRRRVGLRYGGADRRALELVDDLGPAALDPRLVAGLRQQLEERRLLLAPLAGVAELLQLRERRHEAVLVELRIARRDRRLPAGGHRLHREGERERPEDRRESGQGTHAASFARIAVEEERRLRSTAAVG